MMNLLEQRRKSAQSYQNFEELQHYTNTWFLLKKWCTGGKKMQFTQYFSKPWWIVFKCLLTWNVFILESLYENKDWLIGSWTSPLPSALFASMNVQLLLDIIAKHITDVTACKLNFLNNLYMIFHYLSV